MIARRNLKSKGNKSSLVFVMKKLIIITGPQGSGNHFFSRVFSTHPEVGGWKELLDSYWVPSDEEYFAKYWVNPQELSEEVFDGYDYWVANVIAHLYMMENFRFPKSMSLLIDVNILGFKYRSASL